MHVHVVVLRFKMNICHTQNPTANVAQINETTELPVDYLKCVFYSLCFNYEIVCCYFLY